MRLSSTLLYDSVRLMGWLRERPIHKNDNVGFFSRYYLTLDASNILDWLIEIKVLAEQDGAYCLSDESLAFFSQGIETPRYKLYRFLLQNYVRICSPVWASRIPYGRKEVYLFLTEDEQRCFIEAKLMNEYDKDTVNWWDQISALIREKHDLALTRVGREGEFLSIEYERRRTGKVPRLVGLDSNLLGYDLDSVVSDEDNSRLLIEAKTTTLEDNRAVIYLSENEWAVASSNPRYLFHVWNIHGTAPKLLILTPKDIEANIPKNAGDGNWVSVKIYIQMIADEKGWKENPLC